MVLDWVLGYSSLCILIDVVGDIVILIREIVFLWSRYLIQGVRIRSYHILWDYIGGWGFFNIWGLGGGKYVGYERTNFGGVIMGDFCNIPCCLS